MVAVAVLRFTALKAVAEAGACDITTASLLDQGRLLPLSLALVVLVVIVALVMAVVVPFALSIQEKLERSPLQMWERNKMRVILVALWRLPGVGT